MAKPPRDRSSVLSSTYFVTARAWNGHALFQSEHVAMLFLQTVYYYRAQGKFQIHEFVLMPNHFHMILTTCGEVTLERTMQLIRGGFSFRAGKELGLRKEIWQRGYVDHRIRNLRDFLHHQEYVRANPVRARLVYAASDYRFSSAFPAYELDPIPQGLKPA